MRQASGLLNIWLLSVILAVGVRTLGQEWFLFSLQWSREPWEGHEDPERQ